VYVVLQDFLAILASFRWSGFKLFFSRHIGAMAWRGCIRVQPPRWRMNRQMAFAIFWRPSATALRHTYDSKNNLMPPSPPPATAAKVVTFVVAAITIIVPSAVAVAVAAVVLASLPPPPPRPPLPL
jgi:hypothetical protein